MEKAEIQYVHLESKGRGRTSSDIFKKGLREKLEYTEKSDEQRKIIDHNKNRIFDACQRIKGRSSGVDQKLMQQLQKFQEKVLPIRGGSLMSNIEFVLADACENFARSWHCLHPNSFRKFDSESGAQTGDEGLQEALKCLDPEEWIGLTTSVST